MKSQKYVFQPIYKNILEFHKHSIILRKSTDIFSNNPNLDPHIFCMRTEKFSFRFYKLTLGWPRFHS